MAFYLQIPGIKGSVTDSQHKEWIAIHNVSFNTASYVSVKPGHVNDRSGSIPSVSDFVLTKLADISSPKLLGANLGGKVFDKVIIHACNNDQKPYIEYTLHKAMVSTYDVEGKNSEVGAHTRIQETITLNATKIEMRYLPANGTPVSIGYDLETVELA